MNENIPSYCFSVPVILVRHSALVYVLHCSGCQPFLQLHAFSTQTKSCIQVQHCSSFGLIKDYVVTEKSCQHENKSTYSIFNAIVAAEFYQPAVKSVASTVFRMPFS